MDENIVGTLFDEKFDNHDFILSIRQLQETLSDKDKIGEIVLRWTDYDQPPMYYVKATEYINLYQSIKNNIDIMVDVSFETVSDTLEKNIANLLEPFKKGFHTEFWVSDNKKSNFLIIRDVKNQLSRAYNMVKQLVKDIDKERQQELKRNK